MHPPYEATICTNQTNKNIGKQGYQVNGVMAISSILTKHHRKMIFMQGNNQKKKDITILECIQLQGMPNKNSSWWWIKFTYPEKHGQTMSPCVQSEKLK